MRPRRSGVGSLGLSGSKAVFFKRGPCVKDHPPFIHFPTQQVKEKLEKKKKKKEKLEDNPRELGLEGLDF